MEISEFLQDFIKKGKDKTIFNEIDIKTLKDYFCNISFNAINFDDLQKYINNLKKGDPLKSADILKINPKKEFFSFVEFKGMEIFLKGNFPKGSIDKNNPLDSINKKIEGYNLLGKIEDSFTFFLEIIELFYGKNIPKELSIFPKYFYFLTDITKINGEDIIASSLDFLSNSSSKNNILDNLAFEIFNDNIDELKYPNIMNLQKPKLLNCKEFEIVFSKIN
jgi:hypothetical protein